MDEETRQALEGSIKKWEMILAGEIEDEGANNCPLCKMFFDGGCDGCPVAESTEFPNCEETPYWRYRHWVPYDDSRNKEAAEDEIEFLKSLRDE